MSFDYAIFILRGELYRLNDIKKDLEEKGFFNTVSHNSIKELRQAIAILKDAGKEGK